MPPPKRESVVPKPVAALYNVMQSVEARLGGGEGVQGIYGSVTASGACVCARACAFAAVVAAAADAAA